MHSMTDPPAGAAHASKLRITLLKLLAVGLGLGLGIGIAALFMANRNSLNHQPRRWNTSAITSSEQPSVDPQDDGSFELHYQLANTTSDDYDITDAEHVRILGVQANGVLSRPFRERGSAGFTRVHTSQSPWNVNRESGIRDYS